MRAACWYGKNDVRVEDVPDPTILNPRDAIIKTKLTTICGSDLHLYEGLVPAMEKGDILGHEIVGEVVETGSEVEKIHKGDRVIVSSIIGCGNCWYCKNGEYSLCDNSNPSGEFQEKMFNFSTAGIFGYSHLFGGYAGSQAEYLRVPYADIGCFKAPDGMTDEQALACSDAFPTGYMAADFCGIKRGDIVAVWGCGPVGLFAIKSAYLMGAEHVIAIDDFPARLELAAKQNGTTVLNHKSGSVAEATKELTGGRGPDACIDAVGMEAHGASVLASAYDSVKQGLMMETGRSHVVREMIQCCRKGGTLSLIGEYAGVVDKFPLGIAFNKGLHMHMGQMHGQKYIPRLFEYWQKGQVDPGFVFTHHLPLEETPTAYEMFKHKRDNCIKIALTPESN